MKRDVLFLCTANACRSQMAEGLARSLLPPDVVVYSAGTKPSSPDPRALYVLSELGIDTTGMRSKSLGEIPMDNIGTVITLCDSAQTECPTIPGTKSVHWSMPDPAQAGTGDEALPTFRAVRDDLLGRIARLAKQLAPLPALGIVGGSGFYDLAGLENVRELSVTTPFGAPSGAVVEGMLHGKRVVFLARHGKGHRLLPSEINARANIVALKRCGVKALLSVSAVGSLRQEIAPGDVVFADQFIDRTMGRPSTFFGGGVVAHVSLADPTCKRLTPIVQNAAVHEGANVHQRGTYVCVEGPQFSTRAESHLFRQWGADVVGMTNLPEARLAREAEICYVPMALPTDYDSWRPHDEVRASDALAVLAANVEKAKRIVHRAIASVDLAAPCSCQVALDTALVSDANKLEPSVAVRFAALLARKTVTASALDGVAV